MPILCPCVPDVGKPSFKGTVIMLFEGSPNPSAIVVTSYYDIFDFEDLNSILDNREQVDVRRRSLVGNISMHEKLSRLKPHYLIRRHS